jgi:hypothetical protein
MSWFKNLFKKSPPHKVEVGKAKIMVTLIDKRFFELEYVGDVSESLDEEWVTSAKNYVQHWQSRNGENGTVNVGKGKYIPFCMVSEIDVTYFEHQVEVP